MGMIMRRRSGIPCGTAWCVVVLAAAGAVTAAPPTAVVQPLPAVPEEAAAAEAIPPPAALFALPGPAADWVPPVRDPAVVPTTPDTLAAFTQVALTGHPRIRAADAAVAAARGLAVQARLYPNPVVAAGSPQANGAYSQWNVFMTQDIVTAGKLQLQQQAALRQVEVAGFELVRARFDVLAGTRRTFYDLLVAQRRRQILAMLRDVAETSARVSERLAQGGEASRTDTLFFTIARDQALVRLDNADVYVETGRRELAAAVGQPEMAIGDIRGDLSLPLPDFDLPALQRAVVAANAKPQAARAAIERARWLLSRARVQPIPDVNVLGGYQAQVDFPPQPQGLMQVMVEVPLFDRNQGNVRAASAQVAEAVADWRRVELDLATLTAEAVAGYRTGQQLVRKYEADILPKSRRTLEATQRLYAAGEVTFLNLFEAQRVLFETELGYLDALERRWRHAVMIADLLQLEDFPFANPPAAAVAP